MDILEIKRTEKQLEISESMISNSKITACCLSNTEFYDVNASGIRFTNANLSDLEIEGAQLGGAYIHNIGMPPEGHPAYDPNAKQRPVKFEHCDLNNSTLSHCDLSGVSISDCDISGMTINGVLVEDLLTSYNAKD
jgi:uncharacterized protein YjbI with pentapeptide repeats